MDRLIADLENHSFAVVSHFLSLNETADLEAKLDKQVADGQLRRAHVGPSQEQVRREDVRGDSIIWWEENQLTGAQMVFWEKLLLLQNALNRSLFLGLQTFEGHFAVYPPGGFYQKHLDRFQSNDTRVLSVVLYLNQSWNRQQGGQLRLYPPLVEPVDIFPEPGKLVVFLSDQIPHEVCETKALRKSFAGWFRRRNIVG